MNLQAAFDKVWNAVEAGPGIDDRGRCRLRGENGGMCFAGRLLTDEAYSPELENADRSGKHFTKAMEESGWEYQPLLSTPVESPAASTDYMFLGALQQLHDTVSYTALEASVEGQPWKVMRPLPPEKLEEWKVEVRHGLRKLADDYKLTVPA